MDATVLQIRVFTFLIFKLIKNIYIYSTEVPVEEKAATILTVRLEKLKNTEKTRRGAMQAIRSSTQLYASQYPQLTSSLPVYTQKIWQAYHTIHFLWAIVVEVDFVQRTWCDILSHALEWY